MTAAELRELAQECQGTLDDPLTSDDDFWDIAEAAERLLNAAAILEGAHE